MSMFSDEAFLENVRYILTIVIVLMSEISKNVIEVFPNPEPKTAPVKKLYGYIVYDAFLNHDSGRNFWDIPFKL